MTKIKTKRPGMTHFSKTLSRVINFGLSSWELKPISTSEQQQQHQQHWNDIFWSCPSSRRFSLQGTEVGRVWAAKIVAGVDLLDDRAFSLRPGPDHGAPRLGLSSLKTLAQSYKDFYCKFYTTLFFKYFDWLLYIFQPIRELKPRAP